MSCRWLQSLRNRWLRTKRVIAAPRQPWRRIPHSRNVTDMSLHPPRKAAGYVSSSSECWRHLSRTLGYLALAGILGGASRLDRIRWGLSGNCFVSLAFAKLQSPPESGPASNRRCGEPRVTPPPRSSEHGYEIEGKTGHCAVHRECRPAPASLPNACLPASTGCPSGL